MILSFAEQCASGGHYRSLELLLESRADFALIDSSVYESWQRANPDKAIEIRTLERLGPYPSPPLVINTSLDPELQRCIKQSILTVPSNSKAREVLNDADISGFLPVDARFYDELEMLTELEIPQP